MNRRPTIHDVAAAAGVSLATVSKAINGRYGVASATAQRVLQIVTEMGYESSIVASSMRSRRTGVIGVLVADFEPFSAEILKGVGAALRGSSHDLMAYSAAHDGDHEGWERRSLSRLGGTLIDGAIIVTPTVVAVSTEMPIVAIDPHAGPADVPTVESDNFIGAQQATNHLLELGHGRIGFIAGRPDLRSSIRRQDGYRRALSDARIPFDPSLVGVGRYLQATAREPATALLSLRDRPTAVFAANDVSALAILEVAYSMGLSVPDDLSVIGFDDVPEASRAYPPLTTIRQPMKALGAAAVKLLLALLDGEQPAETHLRLPTRLVRRATTGPPRSGHRSASATVA